MKRVPFFEDIDISDHKEVNKNVKKIASSVPQAINRGKISKIHNKHLVNISNNPTKIKNLHKNVNAKISLEEALEEGIGSFISSFKGRSEGSSVRNRILSAWYIYAAATKIKKDTPTFEELMEWLENIYDVPPEILKKTKINNVTLYDAYKNNENKRLTSKEFYDIIDSLAIQTYKFATNPTGFKINKRQMEEDINAIAEMIARSIDPVLLAKLKEKLQSDKEYFAKLVNKDLG